MCCGVRGDAAQARASGAGRAGDARTMEAAGAAAAAGCGRMTRMRLRGGCDTRAQTHIDGLLFYDRHGDAALVTELAAARTGRAGAGWALMAALAGADGIRTIHLHVRARAEQQLAARRMYAALGFQAWLGPDASEAARRAARAAGVAAVAGGARLNEVKSGAWLYLVAQSDEVRRRANMEAACRFEVVWAAGPTEAATQGWADAAQEEGVESARGG